MMSQKARQTYDSLVSEYAPLVRSHDASIVAATKSRNRFITADRYEIRALKRTLTSNATLIKRSDIYRTHLKHCKVLSRRLLSWNADLRIQADEGSLDEVDLLQYGTACYQFMTATSALAIMNQKGMNAKDRCEEKYDQVDRIREKKRKASKLGMEAYAHQAFETKRVADFLTKLEAFANEYGQRKKGEVGGDRVMEFRLKMDGWLDAVGARLNKEMEKAEVERDWDRVCKADVVRDGVDASAAAEEEALYKGFDEMMAALGKGHSWCPCCGAGGATGKKGSKR